MTPRALTLAFLDAFCTGDLDRLGHLLAPDFHFAGPLLRADSRDAYLRHLAQDPPAPAAFTVLELLEDGDDVCVLYRYQKDEGSVTVAQWNRCENGAIVRTVLIFSRSPEVTE